jgi:serine protease Do
MTVRRQSALTPRLVLTLLLAVCASSGRSVPAQEPAAGVPDGEARERLFREVAAEVASLQRQGSLLKKVVQLVKPTVVHIEAEKPLPQGTRATRRAVEEAGSGVIIQRGARFYVLTNRHVIKDAPLDKIKLGLADGRVINPKQVWSDRASDVAILEISAPELIAARLGDSDQIDIGDFVLAVGSPFGLSHSVTYGIISAKGRRDLKLGEGDVKYQDFLQTDAAINPGNSGGPLLNLKGEVVGINTAIASSSGGSEGIGFTIPINMFARIADQLIEQGNVVRAYLGVRLDRSYDAIRAAALGMPTARGARVTDVTPDSPAAAARIQIGDVIVKVDQTEVEDDDHLVNLISLLPVGKDVLVTLVRGGKSLQVPVRVSDREQFEQE